MKDENNYSMGINELLSLNKILPDKFSQNNHAASHLINFIIPLACESSKIGFWFYDFTTGNLDGTKIINDIIETSDSEIKSQINFLTEIDKTKFKRLLSDCRENGIPFDDEFQIITAKNNIKWIRIIAEPFREINNKVTGAFGIFQDISDNKISKLRLKEISDRFEKLAEISENAICVNQDNKFVYTNPAALKLFGIENNNDLLNKSIFEFFPEKYHEAIRERIKFMIETGHSVPYVEMQLVRADGQVIDIEVSASPIKFRGKESTQIIFRDISERKKKERELKESEDKFKKLFKIQPGVVFILSKSSLQIIDVNDEFCKVLNKSRNDIIGKNISDITFSSAKEAHENILKLIRENNNIKNKEISFNKDGNDSRFYLMSVENFEVSGVECYLIILNDITGLKKSENELHSSKERFSIIFNSSHMAICITELETGKIVDANKKFFDMIGMSRDKIINKKITDMNIEDTEYVKSNMQKLKTNGYLHSIENGIRTKSGDIIFIRSSHETMEFEGKKCILSLSEDITEIKIIENIRNIKNKLLNFSMTHTLDELIEEILNQAEILTDSRIATFVVISDDEKNSIYQNFSTATKKVLSDLNISQPDNLLEKSGIISDCISNRDSVIDNNYLSIQESKELHENHPEIIRALAAPIIYNNKIMAVIGVGNKKTDYTQGDADKLKIFFDAIWEMIELKNDAETVTKSKELIESESRLRIMNETKNKFFSIISHDLRNPFNTILGFCELIESQLKEKQYDALEGYISLIHDSAKKALDLLVDLLEWSRMHTVGLNHSPQNFNLVDLIDNEIELARISAKHKSIQIDKDTPDKIEIIADKTMISIVIRNFISNAIKFTHPHGRIIISAEENNNSIICSVSDNGVGIKKEIAEKLFNPDTNLSTKGTNNESGTGLGLLLCKEFIDKHNGSIRVESEPGKGSKFSFSIPKVN